jgi:hypothetical protein
MISGVYLLRYNNWDVDVWKIGHSKQIQVRLKSYKTSIGSDPDKVFVLKCQNSKQVETDYHQKYASLRQTDSREHFVLKDTIINDLMADGFTNLTTSFDEEFNKKLNDLRLKFNQELEKLRVEFNETIKPVETIITKKNALKQFFIETYKINDSIFYFFESLEKKLFNKYISKSDFEKQFKTTKLIYNCDFFDFFNDYIIALNHGVEHIKIIKELNKHFEKGDKSDFVKKSDIKKVLKENNFKISGIDLEDLIVSVYECRYYIDTTVNGNNIKRIFKGMKIVCNLLTK